MTPYLAASFGRVYPGGAALVDLPAVNRPLLELVASWEAPPPPPPVAPAPKPAKPAEGPVVSPAAQTAPSAPDTDDAGVQLDTTAKSGVPGCVKTLPLNGWWWGTQGCMGFMKYRHTCKCGSQHMHSHLPRPGQGFDTRSTPETQHSGSRVAL